MSEMNNREEVGMYDVLNLQNFPREEKETINLAELYDSRFHEEIDRDPYKCKPWFDHVQLLKTLRPQRSSRQLFRICEIKQLDVLESAEDSVSGRERDISESSDSAYNAITKRIFSTYERASEYIPLSYKIWYNYLKDSIEDLCKYHYEDPESYSRVNALFERCLVNLYAYPAIYLLYGSFLRIQNCITRVRKLYDRALLNLAITQHSLIWKDYIEFVNQTDLLPLGRAVLLRYIQIKPNYREVLYEFLKRHGEYDEACKVLCELLNDKTFVSESGKTHYDLWVELCELIRNNSKHITSTSIDIIIREGIKRYTDQVAYLWLILADIYILRGQMYIARDVYEEALKSVTTVQDFSTIFDVYAKFLESLARERCKAHGDITDSTIAVDRLESLINNRAMLLANVKLKQNVHNVYNWIHYTQLVGCQPEKVAEVYAEAVRTVDPKRCVGRITDLWIKFASFYEDRNDIEKADEVFEKATNADFKFVDDLATIWCAWAEMYLRHKEFTKALEISRRAVDVRNKKEANSVERRLYRSVKLWSLSLDMEQNFGTVATSRATFDLMVELKVVTPQIALNFAMYLEERKYFEASSNAFEKCVALFKWPQLYYLYLPYLTKFVNRYRGKKLERAREIFDCCIYSGDDSKLCVVPPKFVKYIFYLYAHMEEEFGLIKRCLGILKDATRCAAKEDQLTMIKLFIAKTTEFYGIVHTRRIYQDSLEFVDDDIARELCGMYIQMERGLGEIDRARAIFVYCSQMCDPSVHDKFWKEWREFEVLHGNEECFREMLRIKRSVQVQYSKVRYNTEEITDSSQQEDGSAPT